MSRTFSSAGAVGLATIATIATVTATGPASAARLHTPDEAGDTYERVAPLTFEPAGSRTNTDVVGSSVRHTLGRVNSSVRYSDLVRNDDRIVTPVRIHASNGKTYLMRVTAGPGDRDGTARLVRYTGRGFETVRVACKDVRFSISYADDLVAMNVPRSCLGHPSWVEYGGTVKAVDAEDTVFTDALLSADPGNDLYSERIERG